MSKLKCQIKLKIQNPNVLLFGLWICFVIWILKFGFNNDSPFITLQMLKPQPNSTFRNNPLYLLRPFHNHNVIFAGNNLIPTQFKNIFWSNPIRINMINAQGLTLRNSPTNSRGRERSNLGGKKKPSFLSCSTFLSLYIFRYIPIPIPPIPLISGMPPPFSFFSGTSVTTASVVRSITAAEIAFFRALVTTFAGSMIPSSNMSP